MIDCTTAMFFFIFLWCVTVLILIWRIEESIKLKKQMRYATFTTDYDDTEERDD